MPQGEPTPEPLKQVIMADCILMPVSKVAEKWEISPSTINNWLAEVGGVKLLRELHDTQTAASAADISINVARRVAELLRDMEAEFVVPLAMKVLETAAKQGVASREAQQVIVNAGTQVNTRIEQPETSDNAIIDIVAALAESGVFDSAIESYLERREQMQRPEPEGNI